MAFHLSDQQVTLISKIEFILFQRHVCPLLCHSEFDTTLESESDEQTSEESKADSPSDGRENKSELSFFPDEDKEQYTFFQKALTAVQNWFTLFGWSKGPNPISIPYSLRRDVCKAQRSSSRENVFKQNLGKDTKTVYGMLFHLSGQLLPGFTLSWSLPLDPVEQILQLHWQHSMFLDFLKRQGACLPHVMPEFLLEPGDYKRWIEVQTRNEHLFILEDSVFETISKRAWTDVLLQVYKVFVLPRVSLRKTTDPFNLENVLNMPRIKSEPLSSNIYSPYERIILTWLNKHYEKNRKIVWKDGQKVPPMRWIVNFDRDLLDGLVLAAQLAAYCPYLIATHFVRMYTNAKTPAQFLHNCLILVNAIINGVFLCIFFFLFAILSSKALRFEEHPIESKIGWWITVICWKCT
uniref:Cilia- and flagella-associated protein 47 domain-containing protein n=1 Tax=Anas platyrhynchos platyrhynchos TaxID=8840 RepID=U3IKV9_ANAPP